MCFWCCKDAEMTGAMCVWWDTDGQVWDNWTGKGERWCKDVNDKNVRGMCLCCFWWCEGVEITGAVLMWWDSDAKVWKRWAGKDASDEKARMTCLRCVSDAVRAVKLWERCEEMNSKDLGAMERCKTDEKVRRMCLRCRCSEGVRNCGGDLKTTVRCELGDSVRRWKQCWWYCDHALRTRR